jgi:F-type H+-transporting ATPase subunit delta
VRIDPVTARYADALFELAREKGELDRVGRDVEFLGEELADRASAAWLFDARVPLEQKRAQLAKLSAHIHPLTDNFVRLLLDKRRLEVLRELPLAFRRRTLAERGAVEGVVESARPLGAGEMDRLATTLGGLLHREVLLESRLDPELLAGVRVLVANKMIDSSARGRLEGLRQGLLGVRLKDG